MRVVDVSFLNNIKGEFTILSILIIAMIMLALYFVRREIRSKENEKNN